MLSDLQTRKLTRYFQVYDVDDGGAISRSDFERVVENVRVLWGESETSAAYHELREAYLQRWSALQQSADVDRNGSVDIDEWLAYWRTALESDARYEAEVAAITDALFTVFDTDEDGSIGPDEFCNFYGVYGLGANLARSMFVELDADNDGVISRGELVEIGREFFRGNDPAAPGNLLFGPFGV